jgi:hypothetical protein
MNNVAAALMLNLFGGITDINELINDSLVNNVELASSQLDIKIKNDGDDEFL